LLWGPQTSSAYTCPSYVTGARRRPVPTCALRTSQGPTDVQCLHVPFVRHMPVIHSRPLYIMNPSPFLRTVAPWQGHKLGARDANRLASYLSRLLTACGSHWCQLSTVNCQLSRPDRSTRCTNLSSVFTTLHNFTIDLLKLKVSLSDRQTDRQTDNCVLHVEVKRL
jgi:hypothetical protein